MSYNTRRQSGQGMGVGRATAQVLYHQTPPPRPGGGTPRLQQPVGQNTGYSSQQPIQTVTTAYGTQPPTPPYPPQTPASGTPASQGYSTQQYQSQQQQQQLQASIKTEPAPPKAPAVSTTAAATTANTTATTTPTPATTTPAIPTPPSGMDIDADSGLDGSGEPKPKPWLKKKVPGFKVNKRVKRRRQNARLRKILQPKNAIMVLNELKTGIKFTFQEHTNALTQTMFVVNAEVDGKTYIGQGLSKPLAKQNAAENALKALLLEKMAEAALKVTDTSSEGGPEPMQQDTNNGNNSVVDTMEDEGSEGGTKPSAPEDDVPWGSLASFALYKLFTDWQSQGTHVPIPKQQPPVVPPNQPVKTGAPAPMKKIPDNPTERHPVMLLNQLRPGVQFSELTREGTPPNLTFTLGVTIDGKAYTGVAKNKKDAKKEAAKSALAGSFSIFYE